MSFGFLSRMLEDAAKHDRMAREWYASRGRPYPGDPGKPALAVAAQIAQGTHPRDLASLLELAEPPSILRPAKSETPSGSATERAERSSESDLDSEP